MAKYEVLDYVISYPPNKNAYVGEIIDDLSEKSIKYFLSVNAIELVDSKKSSKTIIEIPDPEVTAETVSESVSEEEVID